MGPAEDHDGDVARLYKCSTRSVIMSRDIRWTGRLHNQTTTPSTDNVRQDIGIQEGSSDVGNDGHIPSEEGSGDDGDDDDDDDNNNEDKNNGSDNDDNNNNTNNNDTNPPAARYNLRPRENKVQTSLMAICNQAKNFDTAEVGIADLALMSTVESDPYSPETYEEAMTNPDKENCCLLYTSPSPRDS